MKVFIRAQSSFRGNTVSRARETQLVSETVCAHKLPIEVKRLSFSVPERRKREISHITYVAHVCAAYISVVLQFIVTLAFPTCGNRCVVTAIILFFPCCVSFFFFVFATSAKYAYLICARTGLRERERLEGGVSSENNRVRFCLSPRFARSRSNFWKRGPNNGHFAEQIKSLYEYILCVTQIFPCNVVSIFGAIKILAREIRGIESERNFFFSSRAHGSLNKRYFTPLRVLFFTLSF